MAGHLLGSVAIASVIRVLAEGSGVLGGPAERKRADAVDALGKQELEDRPWASPFPRKTL